MDTRTTLKIFHFVIYRIFRGVLPGLKAHHLSLFSHVTGGKYFPDLFPTSLLLSCQFNNLVNLAQTKEWIDCA